MSFHKPFFFWVFIALCSWHCEAPSTCANRSSKEPFLTTLGCPDDFDLLKGPPLSTHFSQIDALKLVYDSKTDSLYFINNNQYRFHFDFCARYLGYTADLETFNQVEYGHQGTRRFLLATLNFYRAQGKFVLEFFSDDWIPPQETSFLYERVQACILLQNRLYIVLPSGLSAAPPGITPSSILSVDQLFAGQSYQPMSTGRACGYLQMVSKDEFESRTFHTNDIIFTNFLPNDLPYCQGILTTALQPPLAHINILSNHRKTPNSTCKWAWESPYIQQLAGKLVYYEVTADTFLLREASLKEANTIWEMRRPINLRKLSRNLSVQSLLDIGQIDRLSAPSVGAKAANFGELDKIRLPDHQRIPLPEGAFAIPFYFYVQHMERHGLQPLADSLIHYEDLGLTRLQLDQQLKRLRDRIHAGSLDPNLINQIVRKMKTAGGFTDFRFRSSTNAEDLEGFSGAGLYTSKTGSLTRPDKSVESAVKKVWASLWTLRAFEERAQARIDQSQLAMGILVHRAFGAEEANGVAITRHLYREHYPAFTVNIQLGEVSIVLPENQATAEQILIKYDNLNPEKAPDVEYITHSSLNNNQPLLTAAEIQELSKYLYAIKKHFYYASGGAVLGPGFFDFALDIEFKLDRETRKLYIKQVRPF